MSPLVSVIIAVYNGERYLRETIESVLAQTFSPIECIIVNDGSEDGTESIIKQYHSKVHYLSQVNQGQGAAINLALSVAQGMYIAFLDADDLYTVNKIALQVEFLQDRPQVDMVFGYIKHFISPDLSIEEQAQWECPTNIQPCYLAAAGLFRRECFDRIGGFNTEQRIGTFIEWYMRGTEKGLQQALIPHKVLMRRIHKNNLSTNARLEYLNIIKVALARRSRENSAYP
ncbi:MAG: glycosyltransferase [Simkaniaceae bacterium]|nr:glycosyltransferase [Simkaniaceae bacterium]